MVPGKEMEDNLGGVEVDEIDAIQGTIDDVIYNLWFMKEPNYVMRIMDAGGRLLADDICKETVIIWNENVEDMLKKFKYKLPFDWQFCYGHAVGDHNKLRHAPPSIEDT